ncbi:unnamed protein product [Heterobilharzia americana]|nr:unnamed protein product [Heterobilharzia americana]
MYFITPLIVFSLLFSCIECVREVSNGHDTATKTLDLVQQVLCTNFKSDMPVYSLTVLVNDNYVCAPTKKCFSSSEVIVGGFVVGNVNLNIEQSQTHRRSLLFWGGAKDRRLTADLLYKVGYGLGVISITQKRIRTSHWIENPSCHYPYSLCAMTDVIFKDFAYTSSKRPDLDRETQVYPYQNLADFNVTCSTARNTFYDYEVLGALNVLQRHITELTAEDANSKETSNRVKRDVAKSTSKEELPHNKRDVAKSTQQMVTTIKSALNTWNLTMFMNSTIREYTETECMKATCKCYIKIYQFLIVLNEAMLYMWNAGLKIYKN